MGKRKKNKFNTFMYMQWINYLSVLWSMYKTDLQRILSKPLPQESSSQALCHHTYWWYQGNYWDHKVSSEVTTFLLQTMVIFIPNVTEYHQQMPCHLGFLCQYATQRFHYSVGCISSCTENCPHYDARLSRIFLLFIDFTSC